MSCCDDRHRGATVSWGIVGFSIGFMVSFVSALITGIVEEMAKDMTFSSCGLSCANGLAYTLVLLGSLVAGGLSSVLFGGGCYLACSACEDSGDEALVRINQPGQPSYHVVIESTNASKGLHWQHHSKQSPKGFEILSNAAQMLRMQEALLSNTQECKLTV